MRWIPPTAAQAPPQMRSPALTSARSRLCPSHTTGRPFLLLQLCRVPETLLTRLAAAAWHRRGCPARQAVQTLQTLSQTGQRAQA